MSYKRINDITGWLVSIIATTVYILTMEKNGSLWDCGEFASSAFKLQVPHSPGAPFFVLLGRLFMAPFDPANAATGINFMSALSSGLTILFLFWTITHFAKKIVCKVGEELDGGKIAAIIAAGVVGALAYTFSDTFWYDAVEGEVYALSSFFTALLFWLMLKWENDVTAEQAAGINGHFTKADRYIVVIFFLMGLSIGVHLLNLLIIPAITMIYFYKRYTTTNWKTFLAFIIGVVITGFTQKALIQWTVKAAGNFDILFVNDFGLPYFTGFAFFFLMLVALCWFGLRIAQQKNWNLLKLGVWCFMFITLGCFASYSTTLVRSNANVSVDMNEVDNPVNLMSYLSREQYGDWPILYGQDFTAQIQDSKVTETYVKADGKYLKEGRKVSYIYAPEDMHLFPRMWDQSNDQGRADYYADFAGIGKNKDGTYEHAPSMGDNVSFFMSYQINWMYMRYFLWNFAGKQNDNQGSYLSNVRDGNWKTGIGFLDAMRLGDQNKLPDTLKNNKANNKLYMLPFILGLLGVFYQAKKDKKDAFVVGLFFFFTGIAISLYLNMAGNQPRERDYAFVGSFYVFAIWIGLGVLYIKDLLLPILKSNKNAAIAAGIVCTLAVPVIMASQEWDDHDRSQKTMAPDLAKDYLESCAPNAILFTFGDNDTYPLWYAQEVLGVRPDIRVMNTSLLGTDWYINQLRYKVNQSDSVDVIWTPEQIRGSNRDVVYNAPKAGIDPNNYMDLYTMMKDYAGSDDPAKMEQGRDGNSMNVFPSKKVSVPVDIAFVKQNGTANATDSVVSQLQFEIPKNYIYKNDAAILNVIAANKWKRPIYFTSPYGELGFQQYLRQDGLSYRLVPVLNGEVNKDWALDKMMNKFVFGGADKKAVYFDEENRRHLNSIRYAYALAASNLADGNRKEDAKKLLHKVDNGIPELNMPYGMASRGQQQNQFSLQLVLAAYKAGDTILANKISTALKKDMQQQASYYESLSENKREAMRQEEDRNNQLLGGLLQMEQQFKNPIPATENPGVIKTQGK
ncbi:MAG: DUF2723 domain-containing protein [Ferruginibacter sp.]|nr:DUF2723 domain-containing protein [Ferruginibacter sp.]